MVRLPPRLRPLFPYLKPIYTTMTRAVAPVSVAVGRRRGVPAGVVQTLEQAAVSSGGRCALARPSETITRRPPLPGGADALFDANLRGSVPPRYVAELPGGRVLGPHGAVITGRGELVQDLSFYFGTTRPREHPLFLHPFPPPAVNVTGRLGVLATRGDSNYYHFLMDVLPRLAILAAQDEIEPPERWYVPVSEGFQRELLDRVGITEERRIDSTTVRHVRAETLVVPAPPSMLVVNPPWVVEYLRATLLPTPIERVEGRSIYVTRGTATNNRAVRNEGHVMDVLRGRGFLAIDPGAMSVADQIRAFAEASVIVAPHGAALANLAFASPGATVVELFPAADIVPDYWKLACGVNGLVYRYLLGSGSALTANRSRMLVSDIEVNVAALDRILDDVRDGTSTDPVG